jgi:hypothetical protein
MHRFILLFTRVGFIFFPRTIIKNENNNFFFRERKQQSRKLALVALMIMYVSLVAKSDENRWQLLVDMIQVSCAVLR